MLGIFNVCSTPSGIKGRNAGAVPLPQRPAVLNAFRHQRKKRTRTRRRDCIWPRCAQRLPASKEETQRARAGLLLHIVLNAFRHQRKKRRALVKRPWCRTTCAQRLPASKEETLGQALRRASGPMCSTPSGIKGRNARSIGSVWRERPQCSTPSGIKGRNADVAKG